MGDGVTFDFTEVIKLAADLGEMPARAGRNVRKAVEVTARHVKDDWRRPIQGSSTVPQGASSISYDVKSSASDVSAEIGPELRGQGPIVGILETGTPTVGARGFGAAALERNREDFEFGLTKALEDAEREAGL